MTPSPAPDHLEERLRSALNARTAQITPVQLTYTDPPPQAGNWLPRWAAVGGVAACTAGAVVVAAVNYQSDDEFAVASGTDYALAGVGYDLPAGWTAVGVTAPAGLRRACLVPDDGGVPSDGTCPALELMVAAPVPDSHDGGALGTDEFGIDACGDDYRVQWQVDPATIDGAPATLNTVRCVPGAQPQVFWTLDGWNLALFVRDARWTNTADTVLDSVRISSALRETAEASAAHRAEPTATASPSESR